jgi:hypothetical protein
MRDNEKQKLQNQALQDFFERQSRLLEFKMPPMALDNYLSGYDEKKYNKPLYGSLSYGRFVSPWLYEEAILKKYASKVLFHAAPQHNPMAPDSRFIIFVAQADSKKDIHLVMSVASADLSDLPSYEDNSCSDIFKIFVSLEIYARSGKDFVNFLKKNASLQSEIPEFESPDMGFKAHLPPE